MVMNVDDGGEREIRERVRRKQSAKSQREISTTLVTSQIQVNAVNEV
jgi:hypothetical protein